ncbi:MAG TPA: hypothetical protein VGY76_05505 [Solirubrobacteraceae bacterium]|jgi:hypothetical protein|nr:hypothetical protein [Solirubrobacteraceae bacterium]
MRGFVRWWLHVSASTWLARAFLTSVGIVVLAEAHGWSKLIPVVFGGPLLVVILCEEIRKRRSSVAP